MVLHLNARPDEVMRAVEALWEFGRAKGVPEKALFGLALALEECGSNIVNHALQGDPSQKFQASIDHTGGAVTIELRDRGPEFDPTEHRQAAPHSLEEQTGGWGIQLVRHYMDEIRYERKDGENVLQLTKHLVQEASSL
jgi:anti-sigma regulatory factor (Ser/Thr protein kinase)